MPRTRPWQALGVWLVVSVLGGLLAPAWAQSPRQETLQSNAAATGNGTQVTTLGYSLAAVQIVGTGFTGTLNFEASVDGTNYTAVMCTNMANTTTTSTTATASGTWFCPVPGTQKFQARVSAYSAGSVTVTATLMPQVSRQITGSGGGAGSAAVGAAGTLQASNGAAGLDAYSGVTCTNSVLTALGATGQGGCNQVVFGAIAAAAYTTDTTLAADSSTLLTTEHAVKTYVDSVAFTGLSWKGAVVAATTTAGTLASSFENGDTIDGIVLATGDRLLVKNQATGSQNGVYTVAASGAPTRVTDIDTSSEFNGATVLVIGGTVNASSVWTQTTLNPTVGTDGIVWVAVSSGTAYLAGDGLTLTGNTFAVDATDVRTTRTLTIAGTANEVTSSAGAQDLSANRTWTLSLPTALNLSSKKLQGASPLVFEGLSVDSFSTTLAVVDPAANRTVTLPNETGTLCTTGSVCSGYQAASTAALNSAHYVTTQAESGLSNEFSLGSLTTGLILNTVSASVSTPSTYAGTSCTNQFPRSLSASGVATCASVALGADATGNLAVSHLNSGTGASSSTYWRGDGTWATPAGSGNVSTAGGTLNVLPKWDASGTVLVDSGLTDNGSVLTVNRGYRGKVAAKSADYTLTTADYQIDCTAGSGGITLTLPSASGLTGQHYVIYKVDTDVGACTVSPNGSDLLNGVNGAVTSLTTAYAGLEITQVSSTAWTVTSLGPLTIGDTIAASTDASVLTVGTGGVLGQVTPGTDGKVFTMVSGVPAWATAAGGVAIGDTVTSGTAGSVLYLGTSGVLAQDNAHLNYDSANVLLRVGPRAALAEAGLGEIMLTSEAGFARLTVINAGDSNPTLVMASVGGTFASPTALSNNSSPGSMLFQGWDVAGTLTTAAEIDVLIDGTPGANGLPGRLTFLTANVDGSVYERARITSAGTTGVDASACTSNGSTFCLAGQVEVQGNIIQNAAFTDSAKTTFNNFVTDLAYTSNNATNLFGYVFELDFGGNHNYQHITVMDIQGGSNMDSGNISLATGLLVAPTFITGGTLGTMIGIDVEVGTATSATVKYGILVENLGAATDAYGIYIDNPGGGGGAGHNYSLYAVSDGYFGGQLLVDATSGFDAATKLGVAGQVEVQGGRLLLTTSHTNITIGDADSAAALAGSSGTNNMVLGSFAGHALTTGSYNTFLGDSTGIAVTTGVYNVALGAYAGGSITTGSDTIAIGGGAQAGTTGDRNIVIGDSSGQNLTSGHHNTCVGSVTCVTGVTTQAYALALGAGATPTASNQWVVGADSDTGSAGQVLTAYLGSGVRGHGVNTTLGITLNATGAQSGATNAAGGNLTLASGLSTGTGTSTITFKTAPAGSSGTSDNAVVTALTLDAKQHLITAGTAPTVANTSANSCGTTAATIAGTDHAGKVTVGGTAGTSCTITFGKAYSTAPACLGGNETTANLLRATSTTTTVILAGTMVASDVLSYSCMGY